MVDKTESPTSGGAAGNLEGYAYVLIYKAFAYRGTPVVAAMSDILKEWHLREWNNIKRRCIHIHPHRITSTQPRSLDPTIQFNFGPQKSCIDFVYCHCAFRIHMRR